MKKYIVLLYILFSCSLWSICHGQHSVLSSGQWWKLTTEEEGMYSVGVGEIPELLGRATDSIAVFGAGGAMLSTYNYLTSTADLQQVKSEILDRNGNGVFDSGDEICFFGEGAGIWKWDDEIRQWIHETHAYARANNYFIGITGETPLRITSAGEVMPDTTMSDYTAVVLRENELTNLFRTGQAWMGEKFNTALTTRTIDMRFDVNGTVRDVKMRIALASASTTSSSFTLTAGSWNHTVTLTRNTVHVEELERPGGTSGQYNFSITYHPGESSATGYLDFIELSGTTDLSFRYGQMTIRNDRHLGSTARYLMTSGEDVRVWEVTHAGQEREMAIKTFDGKQSWTDSTTEVRRYVAFDGSSFIRPTAVEAIENQDLHGISQADLVVVTNKLFSEQAQRVATLHELFDGINTVVVTDEKVYNEFSSGKQDPMAIRSLLRWMKSRYDTAPPKWLLLFGKGTFDNKDLLGKRLPTVVTFETAASWDEDGGSWTSDDIMGYLSENSQGSQGSLDVSTGRLPAKNLEEAAHLVDKIEGYLTRKDLMDESVRGDWRNTVALLADDADPGRGGDSIFAHSSEVVAQSLKAAAPQLNVERYYADSYQQESSSIGSFYPALNNALIQRLKYGCLLLNYIGHGSAQYIGTERYLDPADAEALTNVNRLPLFVTSTCSYGRHDLVDETCGAEACVLAPAAMIGVIAASRPISHVERFNKEVVMFALEKNNTIGDALRKAKNRTSMPMCIGLIGDPALRLSLPENQVVITEINGAPVDESSDIQAEVLSEVTIKGEIRNSEGALVSDFDGEVFPTVFDREVKCHTLANDNPGTEVEFMQQKTVLYRGSAAVHDGQFEYRFRVPQDVSSRYDYAKLSHYAKSPSEHANGSFLRLMLGGVSDSLVTGLTGPEVKIYLGDSNFREGGLTGTSPRIVAYISDSAGINVGTGLGHDITAIVDGNPNSLIVLNDMYEPDVYDGRKGMVTYTLDGLAPGRHTVTVKAWNIFSLSGSDTVSFIVRGEDTLILSDLSCKPNPASTVATFTLRVNAPNSIASAELQIFNSRGQIVHRHTPSVSPDGFVVGPVGWDVSAVPPGIYLARILLTDTEGEMHQESTKCVVR